MNIKSVAVRDINGKMHKRIIEDMPDKPFVGQEFVPDGMSTVGTILDHKKGKHGPDVVYTFDAVIDPNNPQDGITTFTRPYREVVRMAWAAA